MKLPILNQPSHLLVLLIFVRSSFAAEQVPPDKLLLKDYRPRSIYKIPETRVEKARYPVIDVHSHDYGPTDAQVERWVKTMDEVGLEKTIIMTGATGQKFDAAVARYGKHSKHFTVWCGIDFSALHEPGFAARAIVELERCRKAGGTGVGELSDKGRGLGATSNALGIHIDNPLMDPILEKCAELRLPVNIHVAEDKWMYEPMDASNDGLINAWTWRITNAPGVMQHDDLVDSLERAVRKHPRTTFIACHLANCCSDLNRFGAMLDACPNLYGDIGARHAELAPIPRFVAQFFGRYQDRILYGTDLTPEAEMYRSTFRLLETADEHFYEPIFRKYHWPAYGFALPDEVLKKIYRENALRMLGQ